MSADVLSSILHDLRVEGSVFCRFEGHGSWAVRYPRTAGAAFHLVTHGACELRADGVGYALAAGDFVVLPHGAPHVLAAPGAPDAVADDVHRLMASAPAALAAPVRLGGAPTAGAPSTAAADAAYVCGRFQLARRRLHPVIAELPGVLVVRGAPPAAPGAAPALLGPWLPAHLGAAACEAAAGRPGADVVLARLSDVLFVHAIRAHLADAPAAAGGWVGALRDPAVARALALLHADPGRDWTVADLAREVAMSRSRFAARFAARVGRPPLAYLADWRMRRAEGWLAEDAASVAEVAARLGYRSEAAFRHAFRRHVGAPPGAVRRGARRAAAAAALGALALGALAAGAPPRPLGAQAVPPGDAGRPPAGEAPHRPAASPATTAALILAGAAGTQLLGTPDAWPRTAAGFGRRAADQGGFYVAQTSLQRLLGARTGWRADERPCGPRAIARCALARTFVAYDRAGVARANVPLLASVGAATALSAAWRPERRDAGSLALFAGTRVGVVLAGYAAERLVVDGWRAWRR